MPTSNPHLSIPFTTFQLPTTVPAPAGQHPLALLGQQWRRLSQLRFLALKNLVPLLGNTWAALHTAVAAAAQEPKQFELWCVVADLAARMGDLAQARQALERALDLRSLSEALQPRSAALMERGVLLLGALADWRGALRALQRLGAGDCSHPWW